MVLKRAAAATAFVGWGVAACTTVPATEAPVVTEVVVVEAAAPIVTAEAPKPKNVILMISDGIGFNGWLAADYYEGRAGQQAYQVTRPDGTEPLVFGLTHSSLNLIDEDGNVLPSASNPEGASGAVAQGYDPTTRWEKLENTFLNDFDPVGESYTTYTDSSSVFVSLDQVSTGTFEIQRRFDGGEFETRPSRTGSFYDPIGSLSRRYFYTIDYRDSCNNILFSAETHPPFIEAEFIATNQYLVTFTAGQNSLSNLAGSTYEIGNPDNQSSIPINTSLFPLRLEAINGVPRQFLSATSTYEPDIVLHSNSVALRYELIIHVPKAFTPNNDGLNDRLEFFGLPSENAKVSIYNRWGQLVYSSDSATEGWDGTIAGRKAPEGTYLYEIVFETINGEKQRQKGTFALINN